MSVDGDFERESITLRLKQLVGGRVYPGVPDDTQLERNSAGAIKPFISVSFDTPYATGNDRSLDGEQEQPHFLPLTVECWGGSDLVAQAVAGEARKLLIGWIASPSSSEIRATPGGGRFSNRSAGAAPTRFVEVQAFETTINLGSNDGAIPTPGGAPGFESVDTIATIAAAAVAKALAEQQITQLRFDFPNPVGEWPIHHALGHIPSVRTYSLAGIRLYTDEESDEQNALLKWADPTAGYAIVQ